MNSVQIIVLKKYLDKYVLFCIIKPMPKDNKIVKKSKEELNIHTADPKVAGIDHKGHDPVMDIVKIDEVDDEQHEATAELDDEVLEALNVKKKKKQLENTVDYIPELERDFEEDY